MRLAGSTPTSVQQQTAARPRRVAALAPCSAPTCSLPSPPACSSSGRDHSIGRAPQRRGSVAVRAAVAEPASGIDDISVSAYAGNTIQYALELARTSETYEVHSWMILLGLLRQENSTACKALKQLGLSDLYGAWHEVLWALNACEGLRPRPYAPQIGFQDRAFRIIRGSMSFSAWRGAAKVQSEDLLLSLAAGGVLEGLFPDLGLTFPKVRKAVEQITGAKYKLPDDKEKDDSMLSSSDEPL